MRNGQLLVRHSSGREEQHVINREVVNIGRSVDNDIVIDDVSVSRRHARLVSQPDGLFLEDLDSDYGSFVREERIVPGRRALLANGDQLRFGSVHATFAMLESTEEHVVAPVAAAVAAPVAGQDPVVLAHVAPPNAVQAGQTEVVRLIIHNRSNRVDEYTVTVDGIPADWLAISTPVVSVYADAQVEVAVSFMPPRRAEARAGDHSYVVRAMSREYPGQFAAESGTLRVLPFHDVVLSLAPQRAARNFGVRVENRGNTPITCQLNGEDPEQGLDYRFETTLVEVSPGATVDVSLEVHGRRVADPGDKPFVVNAVMQGQDGGAVQARGQLIVRDPWWQKFLGCLLQRVVLVALPIALIAGVIGYQVVCAQYGLPVCLAGPKILSFDLRTASGERFEMGQVAQLAPGSKVTLSWLVENAETVEIGPVPGTQTVDALGTLPFAPTESVILTLSARGPRGTVKESIQVEVIGSPPVIQSFTADPATFVQGTVALVKLSWSVVGAKTVSVAGKDYAPVDTLTVAAPAQTTAYRIDAVNTFGLVSKEVTVEVTGAAAPTGSPTATATATATPTASATASSTATAPSPTPTPTETITPTATATIHAIPIDENTQG